MSSYTSLSRVLSPFRVQTKIEENTSHIFKMRKALTCFVTGRTFDEFTIVVADEIPIDNSSVPINYFTVALLKKHIWKEISYDFEGSGIGPNRLNLWKVEIPISEENKKILENPEIEYIKQTFSLKELNLKKLSPGDMFLDEGVFPDKYAPPQRHIHIIVEPPPPATTEHIQKKRRLWKVNPKEITLIQDSSNKVQQVPVSESEFQRVRKHNLLYIDKTYCLTQLRLNSGQYFVSRPRKFGKSMFLSMIESFFLVQHYLFKGLHVYENPPIIDVGNTKKVWNENLPSIPVIRLDFSELTSNEGPDVLKTELIQLLKSIGKSYSIDLKLDSVKSVTKELIISLANHEENVYKEVVILVDEYDSPILSVFNATEEGLTNADVNREILKGFFEMVKALQRHIKFCLVTGVTMFSNMELFSGANQLMDMTMRDELSGAYGFTEEEIIKAFEGELSKDYCDITKLRERYNGYSWNGRTKIYNPYSICSFFDVHRLENFWIKKGKTSFLVKLVGIEHIKSIASEITIKRDFIIPVSIGSIIKSTDPPVSLFFQTGYLTIKQETETDLTLAIPNNEVQDSLMGELWANTFRIPVENAFKRIELLAELLKNDDLLSFLKEFNNDLASIPYFESQHASRYEGYYHSHMHMLVRYIGLPFRSEDASCKGRTDMWIESSRSLYFIEYKRCEGEDVKGLIKEATKQIFEKKYYASLTATPEFYSKTKYAIGCVFSTDTRIICGVGIQEFTYESNLLDKKQLEIFPFE